MEANSDLTIRQIQDKKHSLMINMINLINNFQAETKCDVSYLSLGESIKSFSRPKVFVTIDIEVKI